MKRTKSAAGKKPGGPETVSVGNGVVKLYTIKRPDLFEIVGHSSDDGKPLRFSDRSKAMAEASRVASAIGTAKVEVRTIKRPDYFQIADYTTGERKFRTFSDRVIAESEAERIARALANGDGIAARATSSDLASLGRALELLKPTGDSLELAASRYAEAVKILKGNSALLLDAVREFAARRLALREQRDVGSVVAELIEVREHHGASKRYVEDLRSRLNRFAGAFGCPIASVVGEDVQRWMDGLGKSSQTRRNFRTVLSTLFKFAEARGYIAKGTNPLADVEKIKVKNHTAPAIYSPDDIAKLLSVASADFLPTLAIGAFAGLRSAELERLSWSDVDFVRGFITVSAENAKTGSRRLVPIGDNLRAWLAPVAKKIGKVWNGGHDQLYDEQRRCATDAGLEWEANALRHSFISYRLAATQNAAQTSLEAGNSPAVVFKHYRELVTPTEAQAWFSVQPQQAENVVSLATA